MLQRFPENCGSDLDRVKELTTRCQQLKAWLGRKMSDMMTFWNLVISYCGSFFGNGPNWTALGMVM